MKPRCKVWSLLSWVVFLVCRASAIDVKETVNDDMCVLISSLITNAYTLVSVQNADALDKKP
ncbi:hypothetical protein YC2023_016203 [Brassica napus]